ncbi:MAG: histidinol dehydrogenase [Bauldia sp.]|nr:histidinol dehydrogenase [Bauldia sp.]
MPVRLNAGEADFEARFRALLDARQGAADSVDATVAAIIDDVRRTGDKALLSYTERFDRMRLTPDGLAVSPVEIDVAAATVPVETRQALALARDRIEAHHRRQLPADDRYADPIGVELGSRWTPLDSAGLYVPGGTAAYPSSVLMNAVPARVAGVKRLVMVVPAPDGRLNPLVLVAARLAGIDEIYRIGGAQAVAALAYGTATIPPVDKIVGPGNAYVAAAKRRVFGKVGIDMIAGPSEVLVVADEDNDPSWIAADLLAQAEHDAMAQAILITTSADLADRVAEAVEGQLRTLPRSSIAGDSWRNHGALIVAPTLEAAMELANRVAPEHLELAVADPEALLPLVRHAGAVFLGHYTPEAIGDYVGGSNHVLPTNGAARFSSGLSVLDFMKRVSVLKCGPEQLRALGPAAMTLADAEGLAAHGRSVSIRLNL